jgi:hypothetical protein
MPPKRSKTTVPSPPPPVRIQGRVSVGAGMTAGLEIWALVEGTQHRFVLYDRSADGRFASDVATWNAGLNATSIQALKDAAK